MSVSPETSTGGLFQWLKNNAAPAIAIAGILLYTVFSIPATFFYARLGTTPSEVGVTYTSLLSGSTLAVLIILASVIVFGYYIIIAFILGTIFGYYVVITLGAALMFLFDPRLLAKNQKLDAQRFDRKLKIIHLFYDHVGPFHNKREPIWLGVEGGLRRQWELSRKEDRTPDEDSELKLLVPRQIYMRGIAAYLSTIKRFFLRPPAKYVYPYLIVIITAITIALTMIAQAQADEVRAGKVYIGSEIGLLGYHAEKVIITPAVVPAKDYVQHEEGVFLLGQTAQYVIVFSPQSQSTERIPVALAIVTSSP